MKTILLCGLLISFLNFNVIIAQNIPSPKEHFGFNIGDDYQLANYTQTEAYFKKLAAASDRTKLVSMGLTEEGRNQYMMIVSSPENIKNLEKYKNISQTLARAEGLSDDKARALAAEGKAVVWIDGGLHANEVVGTQQLIEIMYQTISRKDPETMRILDNAIILFAHANPDGQELVSNWYMREADPKKRKSTNLPRLYQKYIGHDNNRDFFMMNMKETQNISKQQYIEWMPQIIYNHHQTGPAGSVVAGPPYRDPFNYRFDPLLVTSIDAVGAAMNNRLNIENKPGYTSKAGSVYSTWWNGGLRTTGYFHNMIGLLTEIIGNPTPMNIPLVPSRLVPNQSTPNPVTPQEWRFKRSIDYSVSLNYAVLNYAVNQKQDLLFGIYKMGKNAIEKGSKDFWTLTPKHIDSISSAYKKDQKIKTDSTEQESSFARSEMPVKYYNLIFKDSSLRDARGYILPANQPDFSTSVKFINALIYSGVKVYKATDNFKVGNKFYTKGSYIVKTDQAFRPHVLDMFEPQDHPNDFQYPGGPPVAPYDAAGWTLAYEMGVRFDRILNAFEGPFVAVPYGEVQSPEGRVVANSSAAVYVLNGESNNTFLTVNNLLKDGIKVFKTDAKSEDADANFYIAANSKSKTLLDQYAKNYGITVDGATKMPANVIAVAPVRMALWDTYGGSMPSGWTRWIMEQYQFPFDLIYSKELDATDLRKKYDVIVFVGGAIPAVGRNTGRNLQPKPDEVPAEYRKTLGRITADTTIPQLKKFLQNGGKIITIGSSTNLAYHLKLPVQNALVEVVDGQEKPLPKEKFYIPGSIMKLTVDTMLNATAGLPSEVDVYFDESPVFNIAPNAIAKGDIKPLAWFSSANTLRSGWAWGQFYLKNGVAAFDAKVGAGRLLAFGPEITYRAQTHATYKFLFNQLYK